MKLGWSVVQAAVVAVSASAVSASTAWAQSSVPMQDPRVAPAGSLVVVPSLGIIHESPVTDVALIARARYSVIDDLSLGARIGATLGDVDLFVLGFEGKYQIVRDGGDVPIDISAYGAIDLGFGDFTTVSAAAGPLVGKKLDMGGVGLTPYGGLTLGIGHASTTFGGNTEILFGIIAGADIAFTERFSLITEITIGITDAISILNWHFGVPLQVL